MVSENKKEMFVREVQDFFDQLLAMKSSEKMEQYLEFCKRVPNHSTFNSTLVFIQKPSCFYYATKAQWKKLFNRELKPSARPLLILFPFAPVEFVYDLEDIEGEPLSEKDLIYWWVEESGGISRERIESLIRLCEELGIRFSIASTDYLREKGHMTFGVANHKMDTNEYRIKLHPRYKDPAFLQEAFGVLVHEVAHYLLGHCGEIRKAVQFRRKNVEGFEDVFIAKDAHKIDRSSEEVEAELTAYLVFSKYGVAKKSAPYLAGWITKQSAKSVRIVEVGKVVDNVYKMANGERWWIKKARRAHKDAMDKAIHF
ncbi:hypothetical protein COT82_01815 [Candidatus Campbellbacteria bacterium CG10_big_fil_rev_8_21_14_0_10_35_52]|uniref:IrrE N-terminal-like domain-containing protein n=1 Tax=Candidatus Campbellbacteria bacterium CG10_big_fil_rev_8_21_14_0_10_35_52 TaxID=1974527 RepID=A0A2M6WVA5_9BACT|nr:MAG: hypothetical protein COT82_01815 [Candidatus Campbellbacteria bacterium CG10_big_fil_rev_8_21_14_0_10_35_52]